MPQALQSIQGVDRWSSDPSVLKLRDERGRVFFRFVEAGPTALRAKWRRSELVMLARDPNVFQKQPRPEVAITPGPNVATSSRGFVGVWRVNGPRGRSCVLRLTIDPDSAATRAKTSGCWDALERVYGWSITNGTLNLSTESGALVARFSYVRGHLWRGKMQGNRRELTITQE